MTSLNKEYKPSHQSETKYLLKLIPSLKHKQESWLLLFSKKKSLTNLHKIFKTWTFSVLTNLLNQKLDLKVSGNH
jgi:hypothetical protein